MRALNPKYVAMLRKAQEKYKDVEVIDSRGNVLKTRDCLEVPNPASGGPLSSVKTESIKIERDRSPPTLTKKRRRESKSSAKVPDSRDRVMETGGGVKVHHPGTGDLPVSVMKTESSKTESLVSSAPSTGSKKRKGEKKNPVRVIKTEVPVLPEVQDPGHVGPEVDGPSHVVIKTELETDPGRILGLVD